jgi:hypothetical protein
MNLWVQRAGLIFDICGALLLFAEGVKTRTLSDIDANLNVIEKQRFGDWFKPAYNEERKEVYLHKSLWLNLLLSPWIFWLFGARLLHPIEFGKLIGSILNIGPWILWWMLVFVVLPFITIAFYVVAVVLFFTPMNVMIKNSLVIPLCLGLGLPPVAIALLSVGRKFTSKIQLIAAFLLFLGFALQFVGTF